MANVKRTKSDKLSVHLAPSPLDAAILLVLAEREAGGARVDAKPVISRLLRAEMTRLLGGSAVAEVGYSVLSVHPTATMGELRDAFAVTFRERLRAAPLPAPKATPLPGVPMTTRDLMDAFQVDPTPPPAPPPPAAPRARDRGVSFGGAFRDGGYEVDDRED